MGAMGLPGDLSSPSRFVRTAFTRLNSRSGDGEAETGPLATSWHGNKFMSPVTDGAVLPILHLNGFKIANPTIFSRMSHEEVECFFLGCGWKPYFVEGSAPMPMHQQMAYVLDAAIREIKRIQREARKSGEA